MKHNDDLFCERLIRYLSLGLAIVLLITACIWGCAAKALAQAGRVAQPMIPPLPPVVQLACPVCADTNIISTLQTNAITADAVDRSVFYICANHHEWQRRELRLNRRDMPAALPVSPENAPHFYYGVAEFKRTKEGLEAENDVFSFGRFDNDEMFMRSQTVGNPTFNRKYRAVFKYPSQLHLDAACIWQRREGSSP